MIADLFGPIQDKGYDYALLAMSGLLQKLQGYSSISDRGELLQELLQKEKVYH